MTNLYLMMDEPTGFYKIGHSTDVMTRERTLLAQSPQISLFCYWKNVSVETERSLHNHFANKRRRGEWFELDLHDVLGLMSHPLLVNRELVQVEARRRIQEVAELGLSDEELAVMLQDLRQEAIAAGIMSADSRCW